MKKYICLVILVTLAVACASQQEAPGKQGQAPCIIDVSKQEPRICTMQYVPVCGCNGKTYGNACVAKGAGVQRSRPGRCEDTEQTPD